MQITLKQAEIVQALKQFVADQGINLTGKTVAIDFTAGRSGAGLTASIEIEDVSIPGVDLADAEVVAEHKPTLTVVPATAQEAEAAPAVKDEEEEQPAPVAAAPSLFGTK